MLAGGNVVMRFGVSEVVLQSHCGHRRSTWTNSTQTPGTTPTPPELILEAPSLLSLFSKAHTHPLSEPVIDSSPCTTPGAPWQAVIVDPSP
jgi:hypothetical protein